MYIKTVIWIGKNAEEDKIPYQKKLRKLNIPYLSVEEVNKEFKFNCGYLGVEIDNVDFHKTMDALKGLPIHLVDFYDEYITDEIADKIMQKYPSVKYTLL
jgi:hypothetical protein